MVKRSDSDPKFPESIAQQALLLENIFSEVSSIKNPIKIDQIKQSLKHTLLLPNQMMYLICYNPRGIYFAQHTERFLPYTDDELTIERIIDHISPEDLSFVTNAISAIYEFYRKNSTSDIEAVFTIEHRLINRNDQTLYVQRNTRLLDVDKNNLPVMALSIITDMSSIVKNDFSPRASLFNPNTAEQYFYKEAINYPSLWISNREQEVLDLLCKGLSSKQIAEILYISKHTVDGHRRMLLEKTHTSNTPELISYSLKNKWITLTTP